MLRWHVTHSAHLATSAIGMFFCLFFDGNLGQLWNKLVSRFKYHASPVWCSNIQTQPLFIVQLELFVENSHHQTYYLLCACISSEIILRLTPKRKLYQRRPQTMVGDHRGITGGSLGGSLGSLVTLRAEKLAWPLGEHWGITGGSLGDHWGVTGGSLGDLQKQKAD